MKKISAFLFLISLIFLGAACRKKDKNEDQVVNTDPTTNEVAGGLVYMTSQTIFKDTALNTFNEHALAVFGDNVNTDIIVNSVLLDGIDIPYDDLGGGYTYFNIPGTHNPSSLHWVVNGNNGIPNIDHTLTRGLPVFNEKTLAPNEFDIKQNLNIIFTGLKNADHIEIVLDDLHGHAITRDLEDMSNPIVSISASELATLEFTPGEVFHLQCFVANATLQVIGGKTFSFTNQKTYFKEITPTP